MWTNPAQGQQSPCASGGSGTAAPQGGRKQDGSRTCVYSGRLQRYGKSKRSEPPPGGRRSDSPGIFYKFPAQRSSGSVREALRLTRPPALRNAKIFFPSFQMPAVHAYHLPLAAFWFWSPEGHKLRLFRIFCMVGECGWHSYQTSVLGFFVCLK